MGRAERGGCMARERRAGAHRVGCAWLGSRRPYVVCGGDLSLAMGLARGRSWGVAESRGLVMWRPSWGPQRGNVDPVGVHNAKMWWAHWRGTSWCIVARQGPCLAVGQASSVRKSPVNHVSRLEKKKKEKKKNLSFAREDAMVAYL